MELLLNLVWLLLALPAYWLWRDSRTASSGRNFTPLQCLLALGCILVVLFPVISATDDLLAMRSEMEESPVGKRSVRQVNHEKAMGWKSQSPPALAATETSLLVNHAKERHTLLTPCLLTPGTLAIEGPGRAPPHSLQA